MRASCNLSSMQVFFVTGIVVFVIIELCIVENLFFHVKTLFLCNKEVPFSPIK